MSFQVNTWRHKKWTILLRIYLKSMSGGVGMCTQAGHIPFLIFIFNCTLKDNKLSLFISHTNLSFHSLPSSRSMYFPPHHLYPLLIINNGDFPTLCLVTRQQQVSFYTCLYILLSSSLWDRPLKIKDASQLTFV